MKPSKVVIEGNLEREARREREAKSDGLLAEVERVQERGGYWDDAKAMLGWYFAMDAEKRMESAPAIDYARERVQGLQVDRDQRIHQKAYVEKLLLELEHRQGSDRGRALLWLHFRPPTKVGETRDSDGRKRGVYGKHGVSIRDLHTQMDGASRDATIREFWRAFRIVEELAYAKKLIRYRIARKGEGGEVRTYRRRE